MLRNKPEREMKKATETIGNIRFWNCHYDELLKGKKNDHWDLANCDVPYGIGEDGRNNHTRSKLAKSKDYRNNSKYDNDSPPVEYYNELIRVSKNQILWGANHFISKIPYDSSCWIIWDKLNGDSDFADCELAYTSFNTAVRTFRFRWAGMLQGNMKNKQIRIHPNEKPVALYKWLLTKYAKPGQRILDTHGGSMSHAIACDMLGFELDICEIDKHYFDEGVSRFREYHTRRTEITELGFARTALSRVNPTLF